MEEETENSIWRQVLMKQIKMKMDRYMERTQVEPNRSKSHTWAQERDRPGNRDHEAESKAEYITRLTSLRDSLIDQEELNLAQALDRLRLQSISNKTHSNRLRMNSNDNFLSAQPLISQRRNMISTVERFRQIRPKRHQPMVFPLQGRQMLDASRPASEEPISNFGNATNRSDRALSFGNTTLRSSHAKQVEETVHSNLQRLIQPTSSIPNIGRKALKKQEELEPKAKPLLNIRAKLQKQPGSHLASPFLLSTHESQENDNPLQRSSDRDISNLSPQAHRLGPVLQDDTLDVDILQQYYQSYLDSGSPEEPNGNHNNGNSSMRKDHKNTTHSTHLHRFNSRHSPYKQNGANKTHSHINSPVTQYNSIVSGTGRIIALSDLPDIMPRTTYTYLSTTHSLSNNDNVSDVQKGRFPDLQTSYRYQLGQSDASSTASGVSKSWLRSVQRRKHNNSPLEEEMPEKLLTQDGKKKIVVDMPNIIFNAASPEGDGNYDQVLSHNSQPERVLRKAMKQQEIRKKELHDLLEDVKELNMRTEVINGSPVASGT